MKRLSYVKYVHKISKEKEVENETQKVEAKEMISDYINTLTN